MQNSISLSGVETHITISIGISVLNESDESFDIGDPTHR